MKATDHTHDFTVDVLHDGLFLTDVNCRAHFSVTAGRRAGWNPFTGGAAPAEEAEITDITVKVLGTKRDDNGRPVLGPKGYPQEFEAALPAWMEPHVTAWLDVHGNDLLVKAREDLEEWGDDHGDHVHQRRMEAAE